ncbi:zinc finger BED domain-containing protein 5-like [Aedes albopictus]|uniref:SCAN domain-containing protein 3 n=1 Tax=Aedes albopictus TaxID=7160 RepID=A0ABM1YCJ6_AEDAL
MKRFLISNHVVAKNAEQEEESQKQNEKRKAKMRKYDDSYLEFGFTYKVVNSEDYPQCVVCLKIISVESMLPSKLKRHLETQHPNLAKKDRDFFQRKLGENKQQHVSFSRQTHINSNALLASYKVAYRVAQCKKSHTIAEELILPAAVDLVSTMIGEHASQQLSKVPLSNNTIARRIDDMANDINCQLVDFLKNREYALQLDEATDNIAEIPPV